MGEGKGALILRLGGGGALLCYFGHGGGRLSESGRLFEEIR